LKIDPIYLSPKGPYSGFPGVPYSLTLLGSLSLASDPPPLWEVPGVVPIIQEDGVGVASPVMVLTEVIDETVALLCESVKYLEPTTVIQLNIVSIVLFSEELDQHLLISSLV
jgi:hypothetical protein